MSWYGEHVLPRIVDLTCGGKRMHPVRRPALEGLAGTVVELGFGSGPNVGLYPAAVERVLAVEPSEGARALGRKRMGATAHPPIDFVGLDGARLPLDDDSVDAVLSTFTLCTIPDVDAAMREVGGSSAPAAHCTSSSTAGATIRRSTGARCASSRSSGGSPVAVTSPVIRPSWPAPPGSGSRGWPGSGSRARRSSPRCPRGGRSRSRRDPVRHAESAQAAGQTGRSRFHRPATGRLVDLVPTRIRPLRRHAVPHQCSSRRRARARGPGHRLRSAPHHDGPRRRSRRSKGCSPPPSSSASSASSRPPSTPAGRGSDPASTTRSTGRTPCGCRASPPRVGRSSTSTSCTRRCSTSPTASCCRTAATTG